MKDGKVETRMDQGTLYELAFAYRETKLWEKMYDSELFAVVLPNGEVGYCSVLGMLGDYLALGVYVGEAGLESMRRLVDHDKVHPLRAAEWMHSQDCLQCVFQDREETEARELLCAQIVASRSGFSLTGHNVVPCFLRARPAGLPFPISEDEQRGEAGETLGVALRAALAVSAALESRSKIELGFRRQALYGCAIPLLTPDGDGFRWSAWDLPPRRLEENLKPELRDELLLARLKRSKKRCRLWLCDLLMVFGQAVQDDDDTAPVFPYMLMCVDCDSGTGMAVRPVLHLDESSAEQIVWDLAGQMLEYGTPRRVEVVDQRTFDLLSPLARALRIDLALQPDNEVIAGLETEFLSGMQEDCSGMDELSEEFMEMDDDTLLQMPEFLWSELGLMEREGMLPPEMAQRVRWLRVLRGDEDEDEDEDE